MPPEVKARSPNHPTARKVPYAVLIFPPNIKLFILYSWW